MHALFQLQLNIKKLEVITGNAAGESVKDSEAFNTNRLFCAISLAVDVMFFFCAISLAPVQFGITCNTEVTRSGPRANRLLLHLSNCTFNASKEPSCHKLVC